MSGRKKKRRRETVGPEEALGLVGSSLGLVGSEAPSSRRETIGPNEVEELEACVCEPEPAALAAPAPISSSSSSSSPRKKRKKKGDGSVAYSELLGPQEKSEAVTGLEFASGATHLTSPPLRSCLSSKKRRSPGPVTFSGTSLVATFEEDAPAASTPRGEKKELPATVDAPPANPSAASAATRQNDATMAKWALTVGRPSRKSSPRRESMLFSDGLTPIDEEPDETVQLETTLSAMLAGVASLDSKLEAWALGDEAVRAALPQHPEPTASSAVFAKVALAAAWDRTKAAPIEAREQRARLASLASSEPRRDLVAAALKVSRRVAAQRSRDLVARLRAESRSLDERAAAAERASGAWREMETDAARLDAAASALRGAAVADLEARCKAAADRLDRARRTRDAARPFRKPAPPPSPTDLTDVPAVRAFARRNPWAARRLRLAEGLHAWTAEVVRPPKEIVVSIPHALFGTLSLQLVLGDPSPRLVGRRDTSEDDDRRAAEEALRDRHAVSASCLFDAPPTWYHPKAAKTIGGGFELDLARRDDATDDLERCCWFSAKLDSLARELYALETAYACHLAFAPHLATLRVELTSLSKTSQIHLCFDVKRGYPDPASRRTAALSEDRPDDHLLALTILPSLGSPDLATTLRDHLISSGFIVPAPPHYVSMSVPGTILALTKAADQALA